MNGDCNGALGDWTVTQEYLELKDRKNAEVEEILADRMVEPYAIVVPKEVTINVQEFRQEEDYYCGPATVKQVLNYITGSSLEQADYAE